MLEQVKTNLIWALRGAALAMAILALIAAARTGQDVWSVRWTVWISAAFVAYFGERVIEPL